MQNTIRAILLIVMLMSTVVISKGQDNPMSYRQFKVIEKDGKVTATMPVRPEKIPAWARNVSQDTHDWSGGPDMTRPHFKTPIPFVLPPVEEGEPFYGHNHCPSITWCQNGDLLAIWFSTGQEAGLEMTILASRLRTGADEWEPASEFFKGARRNMTGSALLHDGKGKLYHINGMGPKNVGHWKKLALLLRTSTDNGRTWTPARPISSGSKYTLRHQPIAGMLMTKDGALIQACDATWSMEGPTAIHISRDGGKTWTDPGGNIRGIHAGVVELVDGRLMAFGRGQAIDGKMPISISADMGKTWTYKASPFPLIGGGQRLILKRLQEGPLLFVSFTSTRDAQPEANGMTFTDREGREFTGHGMYAALSFDDGKTWPVRKLLTPGEGRFNGGAWTQEFTATPTRAEHAGYLAATQTPNGVIHLISSRLYYRFNLAWLEQPNLIAVQDNEPPHPATNPESPVMLSGAWLPEDPHQLDFQALPRVPSEHVVISDVRVKGSSPAELNRKAGGVNQHNYLAFHDGRFWVMWSDGPGIEDRVGQCVKYATSEDGLKWSEPRLLTPFPPNSGPDSPHYATRTNKGKRWIARGFWKREGEMLALASLDEAAGFFGPSLELRAFRFNKTRDVWEDAGLISRNTINNFPPLKLHTGEWMMSRRMHDYKDSGVHFLVGGVKAPDDWESFPVLGSASELKAEEPDWWILPDHALAAVFRDNRRSGYLYRALSTDDGRTWSRPVKTNFPDATSKIRGLRLRDGRYVIVSNPNPKRRDPLTLAISPDGLVFTKMLYLTGGRWVDYPDVIEHEGSLYIAFAGGKQSVEMLKVKLDDVDAVPMPSSPLHMPKKLQD